MFFFLFAVYTTSCQFKFYTENICTVASLSRNIWFMLLLPVLQIILKRLKADLRNGYLQIYDDGFIPKHFFYDERFVEFENTENIM